MTQRLKQLRIAAGHNQKYIAKHLYIKQNTYSQYENGVHQIPINALVKLAKLYNVSIDYLVGLTDERETYPKAAKGA
jgi:transcriptional regulator with XRE-family HTH domain